MWAMLEMDVSFWIRVDDRVIPVSSEEAEELLNMVMSVANPTTLLLISFLNPMTMHTVATITASPNAIPAVAMKIAS